MTHFCMLNYILREEFRDDTLLTENNNAIDNGPLFIAPMALDANTLKLKLYWFDFWCIYLLQLACIIHVRHLWFV